MSRTLSSVDRWGDLDVYRIVCGVAFLLIACSSLRAQNPAIDDLKGKIFDARLAQQTLGDALKHCGELNGKSFYFRVRNRILDLEEYFRSLENLVKAQTFNPDKRRPWSLQDAKERWEAVKKQAQEDKEKCELVRSLPELEKQLQELQKNSAASEHKD
jgi:tRNA nucleotidyltransferase/poly(A) polymerase